LLPMRVIVLGSVMVFNDLQFSNALSSIISNRLPNSTVANAEQLAKARIPIEVVLAGREMVFRLLQSANAPSPIEATLAGMEIPDRLMQLEYLQLIVCQPFLIKMIEK